MRGGQKQLLTQKAERESEAEKESNIERTQSIKERGRSKGRNDAEESKEEDARKRRRKEIMHNEGKQVKNERTETLKNFVSVAVVEPLEQSR